MSTVRPKSGWYKMFRLESHEVKVTKDTGSFLFRIRKVVTERKVALIHIESNKVVGLYDDMAYAASRARYKYKQALKKAEKILLS